MVEIPPRPARAVEAESIPLTVVYEDDEVLVVDKPAGMVVHPAPGNWSGTLVNALKGRGGPLSELGGEEREGIVHRLDKETSGLLLVAKTDRAHRLLGAAMGRREIVRRYAALCWGHLDGDADDGRQADRARPARPKAYGNRQYGTGGTNRLRAARSLRCRGPAAGASAHRAHAPDPGASLVAGSSGGGRRHLRRRRRSASWFHFPRNDISCMRHGSASVTPRPGSRWSCGRRCRRTS